MSLKTNDVAAVKELIEKQATAWKRMDILGTVAQVKHGELHNVYVFDYGTLSYDSISISEHDTLNQAKSDFAESSKQLANLLNIRAFDADYEYETEDEPECQRIVMLTAYTGSPTEWRIEAYRTYLPEELPDMLRKFVTHQQCVLNGEYRAYIFENYLFNESGRFKEWWSDIVNWAKWAQDAPNQWAQRVCETDIIERILNYPEPQVYSAPMWSDWHDKPHDIDYEKDNRYIEFQAAIQWQRDIKRSIEKAKGKKKPGYQETPIETYYDLNFNRFHEIVDWIEQCIKDSKGLYFWG